MSAVHIVDYGMGNLASVANAFGALGVESSIARDAAALREASAIVLPGVGAFPAAMQNLESRGLVPALQEAVIGRGVPFLGICLGMQLIATDSNEQGFTRGLGWIDGHVRRLEPMSQPVPHVGWNELSMKGEPQLFTRVAEGAHFYFDHSFHLQCPLDVVTATCDYDGAKVAAVQRGNVHAVQFHPEKSQRNGLRLLRNFLRNAGGRR